MNGKYPYTRLRLRTLENNAASLFNMASRLQAQEAEDKRQMEWDQAEAAELAELLQIADAYNQSKSWSGWQLWVLSGALLLSSILTGVGLWRLLIGA